MTNPIMTFRGVYRTSFGSVEYIFKGTKEEHGTFRKEKHQQWLEGVTFGLPEDVKVEFINFMEKEKCELKDI